MQQIDIHQAQELIDQNKVVIVDIRNEDAFNESHIENAVHVHQNNVGDFVKNTDKERSLLCYCYHGFSSQSAAAFFENAGFKTVYSMDGGFEAWRGEYPSVSS